MLNFPNISIAQIQKYLFLWICFSLPLFVLPIIRNSYVEAKWLLLAINSIFCCLTTIWQKDLFSISISKRQKKIVITILGTFLLLNIYSLHLSSNPLFTLLERLVLVFHILFLWQLLACHSINEILLSVAKTLLLVASIIMLLGIAAHLGWVHPSFLSVYNPSLSSTFGNENMLAQFLGIAILFGIYFFYQNKNKHIRLFLAFWLFATIAYCIFLHCRSVVLGIALAVFCGGTFFIRKHKYFKSYILFFALVPILLIGLQFLYFKEQNLLTNKIGTAVFRLHTAQKTIAMIQDFPLGIGADNYSFAQLPYNRQYQNAASDKIIIASPHNELLRWAVEDGLLFLFLSTAVLCFLFYKLYSKLKDPNKEIEAIFLLMLSAYFFIEILFQFPIKNAFSAFVAVLIVVTILRLNYSPQTVNLHSGKQSLLRFGQICFISCILLLTGKASIARYYEYNFYNLEKLTIACAQDPGLWSACTRKAELEFIENDNEAAENTLREVLQKSPHHYIALKQLAGIYYRRGQQKEACQLLFAAYWPFRKHDVQARKLCGEIFEFQITNVTKYPDIRHLIQ